MVVQAWARQAWPKASSEVPPGSGACGACGAATPGNPRSPLGSLKGCFMK